MKVISLAATLLGAFVLRYMWGSTPTENAEDLLSDIPVPQVMIDSNADYGSPEIIQVADNVYVAIGYTFASVTMLVGSDGVIIVDTTDNMEAAKTIAAEFWKITDKPVKVIIYTHHHADHTNGAKAFIREGYPAPEVWAHVEMIKEERMLRTVGVTYIRRASFQFGLDVRANGPQHKVFAGQNSLKDVLQGKLQGRMEPTKYLDADTQVNIAGLDFTVIHIPGETNDQIGVWHPQTRTLIAADDIYKAFPNIYAIRGTVPRDVTDWTKSLRRMRDLQAKCLVTGHYRPIFGEEEVYNILDDYAVGIQHVHDQTVRYMNKGVHPDEIAKLVSLPKELVKHPFLIELYGTIPWSVKGIYNTYLGWFSGDAADLNPLSPKERAEKMVLLLGTRQLLSAASAALDNGKYQWALELASHVFRADPSNSEAVLIRRGAIRALAGLQTSGNGRLYLMSSILDDAGLISKKPNKKMLLNVPLSAIFLGIKYRMNPEAIPDGEQITGCFYIIDRNSTTCLHLRKGTLDVLDFIPDIWDFKLNANEVVFREILAELRSPVKAYITGDITVEGGLSNLRKFMGYIDK